MNASTVIDPTYISTLLWVAGSAIFLLIVLGSGSRFVVFANAQDLLWTAGIILFPVAMAVVAVIGFAMFEHPLGPHMRMLDVTFPMLWTTYLLPTLVCSVLGILFLRSLYVTTVGTILNNGLISGLVIGSLKLVAVIPIFIAVLGVFGLYSPRNRTLFVVLGLFVWIASRMINGERVLERRLDAIENAA